MKHAISRQDREFAEAFEACAVAPEDFDHAAHVRLAYIYLCGHPVDIAVQRMKSALLAFLAHLGLGATKYHETITRAWVMAVAHFMERCDAPCDSAAAFMAANAPLLDSRIMLTHYSAEVLFSPEARQVFVEPDIQAIPPR